MSELKLLLLGTPALERDGQPVALATRKALALLAYLAVGGQPQSRAALAGLLWPDYEPSRAFANLRRTLWALTQAGVGELVAADGETVALNDAAVWTDVGEFARQLAESRAHGSSHGHSPAEPCPECIPHLSRAAELYRGDFMAGFSLRDAPPFDEWQFFQAESLRRELAGALQSLAAAHAERREFEPAIEHARRWLALDPLNEAAQRSLMQLYAASGQRSAALRQYQEAARTLQAELGAAPQPETTALYRQIEAGQPRAPAAPAPRHNLPAALSSFIGREREREAVQRLLATSRLVTLTGAGGSGKTRLALRVAADVADHYADGAWLAELTALSEPAMVLPKVAAVFGVPEAGSRSLEAGLADRLRDWHTLLVLDNCEHVLDASAALADHLLAAAPRLTILATSREPLGLAGETIYRVPSLTLPAAGDASLAALAGSEAGRLFTERAAAAAPGFVLTEANAPAVAQICQRLDGIPLALELAAARVRAMPPEQIAGRLDDRFRLLTGGSRTALPRQQTLRALIDWSWDLLQEPERALLRRAAVFAGGWTLEAAESICSDGDDERRTTKDEETGFLRPSSFVLRPLDILDTLARLVDKSLVIMDAQAGVARYRLLETVRQYARDRLLEAGGAERVRDRHLQFFTALAEGAEPALRGVDQVAWLDRLEAEHDNLRVALDWSLGPDPAAAQTGLHLVGALAHFWNVRGHWTEGRDYGLRLMARPENSGSENATPDLARARALSSTAFLEYCLGNEDSARRMYDEAIPIWRAAGGSQRLADALRIQGMVISYQGDPPGGLALLHESLQLSRAIGDDEGAAWTLLDLGTQAYNRGDDSAADMWRESLAIHRRLNNPLGVAILLTQMGFYTLRHGEWEQAEKLLDESLALARGLGDRRNIAQNLGNQGHLALMRGDFATAEALLGQALPVWRELGVNTADALLDLGLVHAERGNLAGAAALIEQGRQMAGDAAPHWLREYVQYCQAQLAYDRGALDEARQVLEPLVMSARATNNHYMLTGALYLLGATVRRLGDEARAAALLREALGLCHDMGLKWESVRAVERLAALAPEPAEAARLLGAAEAVRAALGAPIPPLERDEHAELVARLRAQLPAAEFERAWAEGRTQGAENWDEVVASVLGAIENKDPNGY